MKKKAVFNWSGGKDSALALYKVLTNNEYEVISLLTTINSETKNSSMHQIPDYLIESQANSIGIPLYKIMLPSKDMQGYESAMKDTIEHFKKKGVTHFIFGDIYLSDVKKYRENQLNPYNIEVVEPLWNKTTYEVIEEFIESGLKTTIIVTQADKLDSSYIGKEIDSDFIKSLPKDVDCCGENGEYHTFVYDGPIFKKKIEHKLSPAEKISYDIKLEDGSVKTFSYWYTNITEE